MRRAAALLAVVVLAAIPAADDTLTIAHAARNDPRFDSLAAEDRRLALALLSYSDSLRIYTTVLGTARPSASTAFARPARPASPTYRCGTTAAPRARQRPPHCFSAAK